MFRIVEMGVALWFPCVLWNCFQPEALWILNPRKILRRAKSRTDPAAELKNQTDVKTTMTRADSVKLLAECWICYDSDRTDAGPLIQPCLCRGDVSAVHHDCLKTWLVESNSNPENVRCKVCNESYSIQRGDVWLPAGLTITHWFQTAAIASIMCSAAASSFLVVRLFDHMYVRTISVGSTILVEYICLRFLGFNLLSAYNRAKMSAIKIGGRLILPNNQLPSHRSSLLQITAGPEAMQSASPSTGSSPSHVATDSQADDESRTSIPISSATCISHSSPPRSPERSESTPVQSLSMSYDSHNVVVIQCDV